MVRMKRDPGNWPAPHEADVHPDEVENFAAGGWERIGAESEPEPAEAAAEPPAPKPTPAPKRRRRKARKA